MLTASIVAAFTDLGLLLPRLFQTITMQAHDELDPTVRIRELKKDRVNFVLENVDLACGRFVCMTQFHLV